METNFAHEQTQNSSQAQQSLEHKSGVLRLVNITNNAILKHKQCRDLDGNCKKPERMRGREKQNEKEGKDTGKNNNNMAWQDVLRVLCIDFEHQ